MFEKLKYFSTIFFGTFIIAVGVYFFMNPNHIIAEVSQDSPWFS